MKKNRFFGPSTLIAAAFIGPGTVTVCIVTGQVSGYALLWALLLALGVTFFLQEMTGRLGLVSKKGLGEAISGQINPTWWRYVLVVGCIVAIGIGNAAYEGGNLTGASLGLEGMFGPLSVDLNGSTLRLYPLISGILAVVLISLNKPKVIEFTLISLVLLMSLSFLATAVLVRPSLAAIFQGTFLPNIPSGQFIRVLAILGTTIVPYNLFLHAAIVQKKWQEPSEISSLRIETLVAILLGGSISFSIVISAASTLSGHGSEINSVLEMSKVLEPSIGKWAPWLVSIGLFAAGISSAITAPLAAGYTLKGLLNWKDKAKERGVVIFIILSGTLLASLGIRPLRLIQLAQVTNAIVLPMIVLALLVVMNKKEILGHHINKKWQNWLGILIFILCALAATRLLID